MPNSVSAFPSITAFTFAPDGLSSPTLTPSFLLPGHLFPSDADCCSLLFTALHTPSLPSPVGKLLCSETRSWHWRETALCNSSDAGDGQLEAAMATAGFPSSPYPASLEIILKWQKKITARGETKNPLPQQNHLAFLHVSQCKSLASLLPVQQSCDCCLYVGSKKGVSFLPLGGEDLALQFLFCDLWAEWLSCGQRIYLEMTMPFGGPL